MRACVCGAYAAVVVVCFLSADAPADTRAACYRIACSSAYSCSPLTSLVLSRTLVAAHARSPLCLPRAMKAPIRFSFVDDCRMHRQSPVTATILRESCPHRFDNRHYEDHLAGCRRRCKVHVDALTLSFFLFLTPSFSLSPGDHRTVDHHHRRPPFSPLSSSSLPFYSSVALPC